MTRSRVISITAKTFEVIASPLYLVVKEITSGQDDRIRRLSVSKTLDGDVVFEDAGITPGDRILKFTARLTKEQIDKLKLLFDSFAVVDVATSEGFFTMGLQRLTFRGNLASVVMPIISKDSV